MLIASFVEPFKTAALESVSDKFYQYLKQFA